MKTVDSSKVVMHENIFLMTDVNNTVKNQYLPLISACTPTHPHVKDSDTII